MQTYFLPPWHLSRVCWPPIWALSPVCFLLLCFHRNCNDVTVWGDPQDLKVRPCHYQTIINIEFTGQICRYLLRLEIVIDQIYFITKSICTQYSCFESMGRFATLKRIGSKIWGAKYRVRTIKVGLCARFRDFFLLFKKRRGSLASSLLNCNFKWHVEK